MKLNRSSWLLPVFCLFLSSCSLFKTAKTVHKNTDMEWINVKQEGKVIASKHEKPASADTRIFTPISKNKNIAGKNTNISTPPSTKQLAKINFYAQKLGISFGENTNIFLLEQINHWLGTPHQIGGMSKNGIDCSGLVNALYNTVYNKGLQRRSSDIFAINVSPIAAHELQEGDLVFFKIGKNISHVGLYLKDNKFVHSSTSKGVIISSLTESYWDKHFFKAGRAL